MRLARTLFLLAATAIAALAFTASANATVEVIQEDHLLGEHCPEVQTNGSHTVTGGCHTAAMSEAGTTAILAFHAATGETPFSSCLNQFEARVHETGDGFIYNQILTEPGGALPCNRTACDEGAGGAKIPWPANFYETNAGVTNLQVTFCIRTVNPVGLNTPCTVSLVVTEDTPTEHDYEIRAAAGTPNPVRCSQNFPVSLTGHWVLAADRETDIEIIH